MAANASQAHEWHALDISMALPILLQENGAISRRQSAMFSRRVIQKENGQAAILVVRFCACSKKLRWKARCSKVGLLSGLLEVRRYMYLIHTCIHHIN